VAHFFAPHGSFLCATWLILAIIGCFLSENPVFVMFSGYAHCLVKLHKLKGIPKNFISQRHRAHGEHKGKQEVFLNFSDFES
jgi:hypothetical protein